jgi:UDP-N-acetylglucosamine acyltransferase
VEVGDSNVFRENVTIHRGTSDSGRTVIGIGNYFMAGSHVAHDCRVGDHCTLANNAMLGCHCILANGAHVGGNSAVHQNCRLGRLCMLEDTSSATVDIPPFIVQHGRNIVIGVNTAGMCRAGISEERILAMQRGYNIVYSQGYVLNLALARVESELGAVEAIRELVTFARQSRRGIGRVHDKGEEPAR